jgi:hypothetical protein
VGLRTEAELEDRTAETHALIVDNHLEVFTAPEGGRRLAVAVAGP